MARSMEKINRVSSPMHYIEENLNDTIEKTLEKKKKLEAAQKAKSPFLVGSIEEVSKRIGKLDQQLQSYTNLIIESRTSETSDDAFAYLEPSNAKNEEQIAKKAFLTKPSDRMKNISKISMQNGQVGPKKDTRNPKFVELHQFPGYKSSGLTPFPHDVSSLEILTKVTDAQLQLKRMHDYRVEFERLFYSEMSQAMLQDIFWWLFLERWQPCPEDQEQLFNRVAHNYVKLMTYAKHPKYRETFLKDYPDLLAQAVYASFCWAFPDSYRQFGETFKDASTGLVYEWVAGVNPPPRCWLSWNFDKLEPSGLKQREELMTKKSSGMNLDWLNDLGSTAVAADSQSTLNQSGSVTSVTSNAGVRRNRKDAHKPVAHSSRSLNVPSASRSLQRIEEGPSDYSQAIHNVARAQVTASVPEVSSSRDLRDPVDRKQGKSSVGAQSSKESNQKFAKLETLTPIREFDEEWETHGNSDVKRAKAAQQPKPRESHTLGKGPTFVKGSFNTYGQSPLVAHFLQVSNLQIDAGLHARVQRTELESLPPLGATTYRDLVQESFKSVRQLDKNYKDLVEKDKRESRQFLRRQRILAEDYKRKETALLANKHEVKRLSDLIMVELKKDQDSIGAGVDVAIDMALEAIG